MTIPYNASTKSMLKYIIDHLSVLDGYSTKKAWYTDDKGGEKINHDDISLLVRSINHLISHDFVRIRKLTKYLKNIAQLFQKLNLPIT